MIYCMSSDIVKQMHRQHLLRHQRPPQHQLALRHVRFTVKAQVHE